METMKRKWGKPVTEVQKFVPQYCQTPCSIPSTVCTYCPAFETNGFDGYQEHNHGTGPWPEGCTEADQTYNMDNGKWYYLLGIVKEPVLVRASNGTPIYYIIEASGGALVYPSGSDYEHPTGESHINSSTIYYHRVDSFSSNYRVDPNMKNVSQ